MKACRLALWLGFAFVQLALASGCQSLYRYRSLSVQVQDAETKQPIPGADVYLWYPSAQASQAPDKSSGKSGPNGVVQLQAAPYGDAGILLEAKAKGYMFEQKSVSDTAVEAIEPNPYFGKPVEHPVSVVIELYAEPHPTVELILPNSFRGILKANLHPQADIPCPAGQRCFRYEVPPSGVLEAAGPMLLKRVYPVDVSARFANGTLISREPKEEMEMGMWGLRADEGEQVFFVGTQKEYDAIKRNSLSDEYQKQSAGHRGGGGGRRGGGHHGNSQPNDPYAPAPGEDQ